MIDFSLKDRKISKDGKHYIRTGLIFRAGDYSDKKFSITSDELVAAKDSFIPVKVDYEHVPGPLDGKLGTLEAVSCSDDGSELYGAVKVPMWLDEVLGTDPIKVSCTWNRNNKTIERLAITKNPRVSDAQLVAAFSASGEVAASEIKEDTLKGIFEWFTQQVEFKDKNTWAGLDILQSIHDTAARSGAVCTEAEDKKKNAEFVAAGESKAIQQIHDMATKNGAKCYFKQDLAMYSDDALSGKNTKKGKKSMNISLKSLFSKALNSIPEDAEVDFDEATGDVTAENAVITELKAKVAELAGKLEGLTKVEPTPEFTAPAEDTEKEELKKQLEAFKAQALKTEAAKFADDNVKKILPANREIAIALFSQLLADDDASQVEVTFNVNKTEVKASRVDAFKKLIESLPSFKGDKEVIDSELYVLGGQNVDMSQDDIDAELENRLKQFASKENSRLRNK